MADLKTTPLLLSSFIKVGLFSCIAIVGFAAQMPVDPAQLFAYDKSIPLVFKEVGVEKQTDAIIHDLTFPSGNESRKAYLITPTAPGPYAAILYIHWLGETETTNRTEFLSEATAMASRGVVSLLVDTMWSKPGWFEARKLADDFPASIQQVIELRRALDYLLAQSGVDLKRVAVVGHDFGAMYGSVMGSVDQRAKTYVLMTPTPRFSDWYFFTRKTEPAEPYQKQFAPLDPVVSVAKLAPATIFYQFASKDKYVPLPRPMEFYNATSPRKQMTTYEADHDLETPDAAADRINWLMNELSL